MTALKILQYPDPRLGRVAKKVEVFDEALKTLVDEMFAFHYAQEHCAALAAIQLGVEHHITVIDFSDNKDQPLCLINGKILHREGEVYEMEGCMSVPGRTFAKVKRSAEIEVRYQDVEGKEHTMKADGFMARCIQHELDHLVCFVASLS